MDSKQLPNIGAFYCYSNVGKIRAFLIAILHFKQLHKYPKESAVSNS